MSVDAASNPGLEFRQLLAGLPDELEKALSIAWEFPGGRPGKPGRILVVGMGTTPVIGLWLREMLDSRVAIDYCRDFSLPKWADGDCLALFVSGSGNSPETVACLEDALERGCQTAVATQGGELERRARALSLPLAKLPPWRPARRKNFSPMAVAGMAFMEAIGLASGMMDSLAGAVSFLRRPGVSPLSPNDAETNTVDALAEGLRDRLPVVLADADGWNALLLRWRLQFNENAKVLAIASALPDADHNTLLPLCSSLAEPGRTAVIWLDTGRDGEDREARKAASLGLLRRSGHEVRRIALAGETKLEKFLHGLWWADMVTWRLGMMNGVDPSEVDIIDALRLPARDGRG